MRDLIFRNLTSADRCRKMISSCEVVDNDGVRSIVQRHFVCILREVKSKTKSKPDPYLYVLKEHNTKEQSEKFFCKIKGNVYIVNKGKLFLALFMHSLKIRLASRVNL
ncbi:MAG: hypothetical protein MJA29_00420 [Candidatus Omnitrophica bacterium]|nr:hypothetical protein [Candidatus Omnitrophota bacterium]